MNSLPSNRILNQLLMLASVAGIIIITAISIELLYQGFHFIETALQTSSRHAGQYFSQLAYTN